MNIKVTPKKVLIISGIVIAVFILMGIFTVAVDNSIDDDLETPPEDKTETVTKDTKEKKDSIIITPPMEGDPMEELDELIGLESVKEEIRTLSNFVKVQKKRAEKGLKTPKMSYHLVFTGSPGTGKTTVARIVARIYKDLGVLKKGHTVETDRSGLVADFMGQTASKTNAVIDSALNGVLFIDEAYALAPENSPSDYGQEAISTLLKRMEDDRDKLVVIVAGYPNEMKRFINSNPGLQSRFNRYMNFPDYTPDELYRIFLLYLKKNQYTISTDAGEYFRERLEYVVAHKDRNFGNARYVRNKFEKIIQRQANRIVNHENPSEEELKLITLEDVKKEI